MSALRISGDAVRLGTCLFDPETGFLEQAEDKTVYFRPQTSKVLWLLCQSAGQLVSRDYLISEVWPDLAVTDDSLTQCISEIRRALGDDMRALVKTVPKRGFILKLPVHPVREEQSRTPSEANFSGHEFAPLSEHASICVRCSGAATTDQVDRMLQILQANDNVTRLIQNARRFDFSFKGTVAALPFVIGLLGEFDARAAILHESTSVSVGKVAKTAAPGQVLTSVDVRETALSEPTLDFEDLGDQPIDDAVIRIFQVKRRALLDWIAPSQHRLDMRPTLAVLPLQAVSKTAENDMLGEFISGEITSGLSRSGDVNVISQLSCLPFRASRRSIGSIAEQLRADFLVSGRYFSQGGNLSIDLELAAPETGKILWSDRFEANPQDLFNGFSALHDVVGHVCRAIMLNEIRNVQALRPETLSNYSVLFGAVGLMHRLSPQDFERSKDLLLTLAARVPHQAAPLAWLARWYVLRVMQGWSANPIQDAKAALQCASQALEIDPENVLAMTSTGFVLTNLMKRLDDAHEIYTHALEIKPNDAQGRALLGMLFAFQDQGEEAVLQTEQALHLAPLDPHRFFFLALAAGASLTARDYPRALELTRASLRHNRTHVSTQRMLVATTVLSGDIEAGRLKASELMALQPNLRVSDWLKQSPSADFEVGYRIANALRQAGIPE